MLIGAAEDSVRQPTLTQAKAEMDLLVRAGFNAVRVTQIWAPGQTTPSAADCGQVMEMLASWFAVAWPSGVTGPEPLIVDESCVR